MGLRQRIKLGFTALGVLLFIAGVISYLELARLNKTNQRIVDYGAKGIHMSKSMLDAMEEHDLAIIKYITSKDSSIFLPNNLVDIGKIKTLADNINNQYHINSGSGIVVERATKYINTVQSIPYSGADSLVTWYISTYKGAYRTLAGGVKNFMVESQDYVVQETSKMRSDAYRAIMQGIIALATVIVVIIVFFFLIDIYFINPVVQTTLALRNYLTMRVPFNVKAEGRDEVATLKNYIEQMTEIINSNQKKCD